jgi:glycerol-3-phosphate acyltransferase PlsY
MHDEEKQENYATAERIISEQNFLAAAVAGAIAAILSAVAYGIVVARWPMSYGFAAVFVGTVVGFFMGFLGRGVSTSFSVLAAVYTIAGCVLGIVFRVIVEMAVDSATSPIDVLRNNSLSVFANRAISYISLVDLVFWSVAVFCAVYLARRALSRSERLAVGLYELKD